jgi:hypothetical protein
LPSLGLWFFIVSNRHNVEAPVIESVSNVVENTSRKSLHIAASPCIVEVKAQGGPEFLLCKFYKRLIPQITVSVLLG